MKNADYHEPVLAHEVKRVLAPLKNARIIDATVGTGGHALELVKAGAIVLGIEADEEMLKLADDRLKKACPTPNQKGLGSFKLIHGNFKDIDSIAIGEGFDKVSAILFDLGVSNLQLTSLTRGFSFTNPDVKLDMRVDPESQGLTGADLLNALREDQLVGLFAKVLRFTDAKFLAKSVVIAREKSQIETVGDFLDVIRGVRSKRGLNPATLPFLALRMGVNSELENLLEVLPKAFSLIKPGGKLILITFHSLEEDIVLDFFHEKERLMEGIILTKKPIIPDSLEINNNPRSRSAEMWVLEKNEISQKPKN